MFVLLFIVCLFFVCLFFCFFVFCFCVCVCLFGFFLEGGARLLGFCGFFFFNCVWGFSWNFFFICCFCLFLCLFFMEVFLGSFFLINEQQKPTFSQTTATRCSFVVEHPLTVLSDRSLMSDSLDYFWFQPATTGVAKAVICVILYLLLI